MSAGLVMNEALSGLRRNLSMVVSIILVTFVSLTFVGAAMLMQMQISTVRTFWENQAELSIYMCSTTSQAATCTPGVAATEEQLADVESTLESDALKPLIASYTYQTPEDSLAAAKDLLNDESYAALLTPEQMSGVIQVRLNEHSDADVITEAFAGRPGVDEVKNQMGYLDPLFSALTVATYIAIGIAALMLIAAALLIATTIRLSAYARRREIGIMRLVGASNRFIQTPFVLEGVIAATIGAGLACVAVVLGVHYGVDGYLRARVPFMQTWVGMHEAWIVVPVLIAIGVVLAAVSAGFAIRRWLRA